MERLGRDITGGLFVGTASTVPNTNGMRNDIIQGFKDAGVGMIEWPGGCAANNYNFTPPNPANDMGTDRYMQLCSLLGVDPYIAGGGTAALAARNLAVNIQTLPASSCTVSGKSLRVTLPSKSVVMLVLSPQ